MKIWTRVVHIWDDELKKFIVDEAESEYEEYFGPIALCKSGGGSAPAPDPNIGNAALMNAQTGQNWLDFAKQQFDVGNKRQAAMDALTTQVVNQQLDTQSQQNQQAQDAAARYKTVYQPLQDQYIKQATDYANPDYQNQQAAAAKTDVLTSAATATQSNQRQMAAMGLNPNSGRFQALDSTAATNTALGAANAENTTRQAVKQQGLALEGSAINMGNGLPAQSSAAASLGLTAGNSAVGNQSTANQNFYANNGVMASGYNGAMSGYGNQANVLNALYGNQVSAWNAQQQANATSSAGLGAGIGSVVGGALVYF